MAKAHMNEVEAEPKTLSDLHLRLDTDTAPAVASSFVTASNWLLDYLHHSLLIAMLFSLQRALTNTL